MTSRSSIWTRRTISAVTGSPPGRSRRSTATSGRPSLRRRDVPGLVPGRGPDLEGGLHLFPLQVRHRPDAHRRDVHGDLAAQFAPAPALRGRGIPRRPGLTAGAALEYAGLLVYRLDQPDHPQRIRPDRSLYPCPRPARIQVRVQPAVPLELILAGRNIFNVLYYGFTEPTRTGTPTSPRRRPSGRLSLRIGLN